MIEFKPLTLAEKTLFDEALRISRHEGSECSFTNLFMWRKALNIRWMEEKGCLCVLVQNDGAPYVMPPCHADPDVAAHMAKRLCEWMEEQNQSFLMKGVPRQLAETLEQVCPGWIVERDRNADDYIYSVDDLIQLAGRKYESKRHHIKVFERNFPSAVFAPLTPTAAARCIAMSEEWLENRDQVTPLLEKELTAVIEVLTNYEILGLKGGTIEVYGRIEAFTLGEALSDDTVVIHVEKANPDIPGIYQYLNREFLDREWNSMTFVNREEDMGIPGLRKAKESYRPIKMVEKYQAKRRR